jgi:hypothetical protein
LALRWGTTDVDPTVLKMRGTGAHGTILAAKLLDKNLILHLRFLLALRSVMLLELENLSNFSLWPRMNLANVLVRA